MKKKLLCMLLSIAMVFTAMDFPASASEMQTAAVDGGKSEETAEDGENASAQSEPTEKGSAEQEANDSISSGNDLEELETLPSDTESLTETETEETTETWTEDLNESETEDEETTVIETEETTVVETEETTTIETKLQADYHTVDEIREFLEQEKAVKADTITYAAESGLEAPYSSGTLSDATLGSAVSLIRQIRYIAGLPCDTVLNDEYSRLSQAAALVNYINNELSSDPSRPEGMADELFKQGCEGAANSNIAYTGELTQTLNDTIIDTWMAGDDSSLSALNDRRRILNPSMEQVGFGAVKGSNGIYSAMYAADCSGDFGNIFGIAWPAQNMPVEFFDSRYPWSVSTGDDLKSSEIRVTLTRESDGKEWIFSTDSSDGDFHVDYDSSTNEGYIIFRPDSADISAYADGDCFQVEIAKDGKPYTSYNVRFFSASGEEEKLTVPKASIASGEAVAKETQLVLTSEEDAAVYYTLDNTMPTAESTLYTEPISIEADITVKAVAIKDGYEDSDIAVFEYTVEEDIPSRYTVTFASVDGTILSVQSVLENEKIELPETPIKEGYLFEGWYKEAEWENVWDFENDIVTQDMTLFSKWTENAAEASYIVSFEMQGRGTPIPSVTADSGALLTEPDVPAADGYLFEGWYKESECSNTWDFAADTVSADTILYAKWSEAESNKNTYTVVFDMQGIGIQPDPVMAADGEALTAPDVPTADGYVFDDWYREADCVNAWNFGTDTVTEDMVLYAKWVQENAEDISMGSLEKAASTAIDLTSENTKFSTIKSKVYDGMQYLPAVKFYIKSGSKWAALTEGVDYTIAYRNNINAGTGQVVIRGRGAYTGEVTKDFEIKKKPMSKLKVVTDSLTVGSNPARSLRLWVYDGSRRLGTNEYTLSYDAENLTKKKTTSAKVVVSAAETSNYTGSVTTKVTVYELKETERLLGPSNVQFATRTAVYTGKAVTTAVEPTVIYKVSNTETITLEKNKDYKLQYQNNINVGTACVIVTGKGQYKGKVVGEFTITASNEEFVIKDIPAKTYNGSLQKPKLSVNAGGKTLKLNRDYIVAYANNLNASTETRKAIVTIAGIGNYAKSPRQTITFEIKPQKISKASLQGSLTTGITLTYNKRTLTQGTDYNTPVYSTVKGSKVAVTITGKNNFTGEVKKSAKVDVSASNMTPVISTNRNRQNYTSFEGALMSSYLIKTGDKFMRIEYVSGKGVYAETYNADFTLRSRKYITMELPKFGGFYEGAKYYFLVFGQDNPNEDNETEVMRIVKYDKKWNRKGVASIYGANTYSPFKNGSLRMVESGDILYIRTCHQMYMTYDGNRHQASAAFSVSIPKMEVLEQIVGISQTAYASHSFNQFILTDGSDLLAVDHGDAYPRSVALAKYTQKAGTEGVLNKGCSRIAALQIQGAHNAYTGVSVGGFEVSDTAYLITGNSVEQDPATYSTGGVRNIFVTSTQKDNFTQGTTVHWITNYKSTAEASVTTPQLVKISGTESLVMWGEGTQVKCVLLNAAGEPTTGIYTYDGMLSDCKPIADNGNVIWYYTNNSEPVFCILNLDEVRKQPR